MYKMYSLDLKIRTINAYKMNNYSYRFIAKLFNIPKTTIQRWVIKYNLHNTYEYQQNQNKKESPIKIFQFLKNSINQNPFQRLVDFQISIKKKFNIDLSTTTISRYLKICNLSKKKVTHKFYNGNLKEHKKKRKTFIKQLQKIKKTDIICLDETYINPKIYSNYGWGKINNKIKKFKPIKKIERKKSILMAITQKGILKYEILKTNYNSNNFRLFIENLITENNITGKYILMDNVAFHKCKETLEYIERTGNKVLFIPPYSPEYNPIEEVFSYIKYEIRNNISVNLLHKHINVFLEKLKNKINNQKNPFEKYYLHAFG